MTDQPPAPDIPKIKRNIKRLIDQNAPEADIQSYMAHEGVKLEDLQSPSPTWADSFKDLAQAAPGAIARTATGIAGIPGDIQSAVTSGMEYLLPPKSEEQRKLLESRPAPTSQELMQAATEATRPAPTTSQLVTGQQPQSPLEYQPTTQLGKYGSTGIEMAPILMAPQRWATKGLAWLGSTVGSESASQAAKAINPSLEPYGKIAGALIGGLSPSAARRIISPLPISAGRQAAVNTLRNEGVDLTAGQVTGRKALKYAESELGGQQSTNFTERQGEQFTSAALKKVGENAKRATPEVIDRAFTRIGNQFDTLSARNSVTFDNQLMNDLVTAQKDYERIVAPHARAPVVADTINDIPMTGMSGDQYKTLTSRLARDARKTTDPELKTALLDIRSAVDNAMERGLAAARSPDLGAWKEARRQYRNMLVIEDAATRAGTAEGIISPAALRSAARIQNRRAFARGRNEFARLSRAGEETMTPLPNSGTASRQAVRSMMSVPSAIGAALGGYSADIPGALLGAVGGAAVPYTVAKALLSRPVRGYLGNQLGRAIPTNPRLALIAAALANQQPNAINGPR